jgi:hypothetical protein
MQWFWEKRNRTYLLAQRRKSRRIRQIYPDPSVLAQVGRQRFRWFSIVITSLVYDLIETRGTFKQRDRRYFGRGGVGVCRVAEGVSLALLAYLTWKKRWRLVMTTMTALIVGEIVLPSLVMVGSEI